MRRPTVHVLILSLVILGQGCRPAARSQRSFDQIRDLVTRRTAGEVERLLGKPDLRETVLDEQRWIWWNYTFLAGEQYAPELRGRVVHLVITFKNPAGPGAPVPLPRWHVSGPLSVSYTQPTVNE